MNINKDEAKFIDHLREAAEGFGAVAHLLGAINDALLLDDTGNREFVGGEESVRALRLAQIAAAFSELDRENDPSSPDGGIVEGGAA